jgi:hypothetical protein
METKLTNGQRCTARTVRGQPCRMPPLRGSTRCFNHSAEVAGDRAKARKRGGRAWRTPQLFPAPAAPTPLRDVASIQVVLERIVSETLAQPNSCQRSRAVASLLLVAFKALDTGSLEERISSLEELARTGSRGPRQLA